MMGDISRRTHISPQDAHKGRPYYGRGLVMLARGSRKTRRDPACLDGWMDGRWPPATSSDQASAQNRRGFTWKMSPRTQPPSIVGTLLVRVLPTCPRPACHGRALVVFARGSRKSDVGRPAWVGWVDARCYPATFHVPAIDQDIRCFYAENVPTHPIPVHSRDAACPRPATVSASRHRARVLPPCPRPATVPASRHRARVPPTRPRPARSSLPQRVPPHPLITHRLDGTRRLRHTPQRSRATRQHRGHLQRFPRAPARHVDLARDQARQETIARLAEDGIAQEAIGDFLNRTFHELIEWSQNRLRR